MPVSTFDIAAPNKICWPESNTVWRKITARGPFLLMPCTAAIGHALYAYPKVNPRGAVVAQQEYYRDKGGWLYLPCGGDWYILCPSTGTTAVQVCWVMIDGVSPESARLIMAMSAMAQDVNLAQVGGTIQTGADIVKPRFGAITADDANSVPVGIATGAVVAARAGRTLMYCKNISPGVERISLAFAPAGAVPDSGVTLRVGEIWWWEWPNCPVAALNGIASAATAVLAFAQYYRA